MERRAATRCPHEKDYSWTTLWIPGCWRLPQPGNHAPDAETFERATAADTTQADYVRDTMAFMFETRAVIRPTRQALDAGHRQRGYQACWAGLEKHFVAPR